MSGIIGFLIALALLLLFFRLLKLLFILFIIVVIAGLVFGNGSMSRFYYSTPPAQEAPQKPETAPREGKSVMRDIFPVVPAQAGTQAFPADRVKKIISASLYSLADARHGSRPAPGRLI